ncbi:MAG: MFS transporter [Anaerolineae bacterium]|nr:MFS transporter [Anaerolineae bacterium]
MHESSVDKIPATGSVPQAHTPPGRLHFPTLPRTFVALSHYNYRLYWFGQIVSYSGNWMQSLAQGWLVLRLTDSPFLLGLVGFISSVPVLILSLWGGVVADRHAKRNLLTITQTVSMILAFVLAFLTFSGHVQFGHVTVIAFLLGIVNAFDVPARHAFVAEVVGKEDLTNAIALNSTAFNIARVCGPAAAGILVAVVGEAWAFTFNGLSFLAVIASLLAMRLPRWASNGTAGSPWQRLREGLSYVRHSPITLGLLAIVGTTSLFGVAYATLMPVFARDVLRVGATGQGLLMSSVGAGALAGALTVATYGSGGRRGRLLTAGNLVLPIALIIFANSRWFPLSMAAIACAGAGLITQNVTANTLIQTLAPDDLRGRVMSVWTMVIMGLMPFGSFQAGLLAERFGAPAAVTVGALVCLAAALLVQVRLPHLRSLD